MSDALRSRWPMKLAVIAAIVSAVAIGRVVSLDAAPQGQPHMEAALDALKGAQLHLNQAAPDKGGHRAKALLHVKEAIAETEAGIAYAKTHQ